MASASLSLTLMIASKVELGDFPGVPVVKNLPANTGDIGSIPCRGTKIPHARGQLSLYATPTDPTALEPTCRNY